jgi:hypothetical protein
MYAIKSIVKTTEAKNITPAIPTGDIVLDIVL